MKKLTLKCLEGWTYVSWQRVFCYDDENGRDVSYDIAEKYPGYASGQIVKGMRDSEGRRCIFALSGESFTMEDFAEYVSSLMECEVEIENGRR